MEQYTNSVEVMDKLYQKCVDQKALASQLMYVVRLQNEMQQMDEQQFHADEYSIFHKAMEIFVEHFKEQVENVLQLDADSGLMGEQLIEEKRDQIADIRDSVSKMAEIFQSMTGSIKNINQPIFPVLSGSMYVFNASLKMITAYSKMLNYTAELLSEKDKYAFLLYPSLTDIIYTEVLLKKREKNGKVVIVTFPESLAEQPGVIPILFHESFHVIERNIRFRRLRAHCFLENVYCQMKELIFQDIQLLNDLDADDTVKDTLINKWFLPMEQDFWEWIYNSEETDRKLYAYNVVLKVEQEITRVLKEIDTRIYRDLFDMLVGDENVRHQNDFSGYCSIAEELNEKKDDLKRNLVSIVADGKLQRVCLEYMTLYREGYADIAACLFLQILPEQYDFAFEISCRFLITNGNYIDREKVIRQYVVSKVIAEITTDKKIKEKWKEKETELQEEMQKLRQDQGFDLDTGQATPYPFLVLPAIEQTVLETFHEYFLTVAKRLRDCFDKIPRIDSIRDFIKKVITLDDNAMTDILLGNFEFEKN